MTDLLIQTASNSPPPTSDSFRYGLREGCRSPIIARYSSYEDRPSGLGLSDLKHSKSDDLVLQSAPATTGEMHHGISDASIQIQKEACVVYEDDFAVSPSVLPKSLPVYYSDSETSNVAKCSLDKPVLKITGDFGADGPSRRSSRHIGLYDRLDPEDSIRDIISENDFYRFVLFKRHYEKYLDISQKYEEARNIAYYLEEKYHEIKAERDRMARKQLELERRLETKDNELHDKEEEMFLQLEKAIRLEEDCEKVGPRTSEETVECQCTHMSIFSGSIFVPPNDINPILDAPLFLTVLENPWVVAFVILILLLFLILLLWADRKDKIDALCIRSEKDRMYEWKVRLEREKNEAYRQLKMQAEESEHTRRRLERARNDVVRQVTAIVAEKDSLERENLRLKEALEDIERKSHRSGRSTHSVHGLEKEVYDLKQVAKQSATLNSQLKKGMKHLATCRRRKCSVCAYTRSTFGEYATSESGGKKLFSCFVDTRKRSRSAQGRHSSTWSDTDGLADRLSEISIAPPSPSEYCPSPLPLKHISYIDEGSDSSSEDEREEDRGYAQTDASTTSSAPHAFSSDSGFSSDTPASQRPSLHRATRWTSSFRRLIRRVSKRQLNSTT